MTIQTTDLTQLAQDFIDAFNHADWERLASLVAPDFRFEETETQQLVEGIDAYLPMCRNWKSAFPDAHATIHVAIANDAFVGQEVTWEGTHQGPFVRQGGEIAPTNIRVLMQGHGTHSASSAPIVWARCSINSASASRNSSLNQRRPGGTRWLRWVSR